MRSRSHLAHYSFVRREFGYAKHDFGWPTFNLIEDRVRVERCFPGATVAWDLSPVSRWADHYLTIVSSPHVPCDECAYTLVAVQRDERGVVVRIPSYFTPKGYVYASGRVQEHSLPSWYSNVTAVYVPSEERWVVIR